MNETLMNIFSIFLPNKIRPFRDSDAPWMNDCMKNKVKLKHELCHLYFRYQGNNEDSAKLEDLISNIII